MAATFLGVRHHSPACARLVESTIRQLRPVTVLVEGPSDFNTRLDELLLGHELPVAIFSHYRDDDRTHASWSPFCEYSPEWVALTTGRECGAEVRFIDLPAWHEAFAGRSNRYADAEQRYAEVIGKLCREFAVDNVDTLWDHLFEVESEVGLAERLDAYFDLLRDESSASEEDEAREEYMAAWIRAEVAEAGDAPVLVVTGGFHRPALRRLVSQPSESGRPAVPRPAAEAEGASYLVPYSFKRLDSFVGYQSGMPSPDYYRQVWESGVEGAAAGLTEAVVSRLRQRKQPVSTADLIAARSLSDGLAVLRGHRVPARTDILDGLVGALVSEDLDQPLPWTVRGPLAPGAHPVVVEMVAALSGTQVGRLHPDTPAPPLLQDVSVELERHRLDVTGPLTLDLADERDRDRSRVLHRLRVLRIPGVETGETKTVRLEERWQLSEHADRLPALIEAGAYGATLRHAAAAVLEEAVTDAGSDIAALAETLLQAALCGVGDPSGAVLDSVAAGIAGANDLGKLGRVLGTMLDLWRHDHILGVAGGDLLGTVVRESVTRVLWLAEAVRGGPAPADFPRLRALAATRDALLHAADALGLDRAGAVDVARRISSAGAAPPDLRGAAFGLCWSLGEPGDTAAALRGTAGPLTLGDWLAGLFMLARDEVGAEQGTGVLTVLDDVVGEMPDPDFLIALPSLRQAFAFFPPRERETIARELLRRRGLRGSARSLLRTAVDPLRLAEARALESEVDALLAREGLGVKAP
jgi:hypothetical protein